MIHAIKEWFVKTPWRVFFLLFLTALFFRLPTLFNDYYDVDELTAIVQTREYLAGAVPGKDFDESKLPVYHAIFKAAYTIDADHGWVYVHFATILIICATSFFLFLSGSILKDKKTGILAGLFYAIFISAFNNFFLATNAEIIFNLPIALALYCLLLLESGSLRFIKQFVILCILAAAIITGAMVKFHGIIILACVIFYYSYYRWYNSHKISKIYYAVIFGVIFLLIVFFMTDLYFSKFIAPRIMIDISGKLNYASSSKPLNPLWLLGVYMQRQGLLLIWQTALWLPGLLWMLQHLRTRGRCINNQYGILLVLTFFTWLLIFAGGPRLYFHYFMACYPALSLASALVLSSNHRIKFIAHIKRRLSYWICVPACIVLCWNSSEIVIKYTIPDYFKKTDTVLYWSRAVLFGTWNHYLVPASNYDDAADYIRKATDPDDKMFVWGDGGYIYYFAERRPAIRSMWPKMAAQDISRRLNLPDPQEQTIAWHMQNYYITEIERYSATIFVDTSRAGLSGFDVPLPPEISKYVKENFFLIATIDNIDIYYRK